MSVIEQPLQEIPEVNIPEPNPLLMKWLEALESGEYKQCFMAFGKPDGSRCALGVLMELDGNAHSSMTPLLKAGLPLSLGDVIIRLNDNKKLSFPEIAKYIRQEVFK